MSGKTGRRGISCNTTELTITVVILAIVVAASVIGFAIVLASWSEAGVSNTKSEITSHPPITAPIAEEQVVVDSTPSSSESLFDSLPSPCTIGDVQPQDPLPVRVQPGGLLTLKVCLTCMPNSVDFQVGGPYQYLWEQPIIIRRAGQGCYTLTVVAPKILGFYTVKFLLDTVSIEFDTDVTCSNGIFCDGPELFVAGKCVAGPLPCGLSNKGNNKACMRYPCFEANKTCGLDPVGTNCASCATQGSGTCTPSCENKTCGDDGCGGSCGTCASNKGCNVDGSCVTIGPGTCDQPYPLFYDDGSLYTVMGNSTPIARNSSVVPLPFGGIIKGYIGNELLDQVTPYCGLPGVPEVVYKFTLNQPSGYNILVKAAVDGDCQLDTLLAIHKYNDSAPTGKCSRNFAQEVAVGTCSDEDNPFAFCASRVYGVLEAGTYTIVMTVYDNTNSGDYLLNLNFNGLNERMECDSIKCGLDVHGTPCVFQDGDCAEGSICLNGQCELTMADCLTNTGCGDRRCGSAPNCPSQLGCGPLFSRDCEDGESCELELGFCFLNDRKCDSLVPICLDPITPAQRAKSFCASDCKWHAKTEIFADLVSVPLERVRRGITFINNYFTPESCTLIEGCTLEPGSRQLIRFETSGVNQGLASSLDVNETDYRIYEFSPCHQHRHIDKFARIELLNTSSLKTATRGYKLGFCISDSAQFMTGPLIPCEATYDCDDQGVSPGWTDEYPTDLPCQWLDITDVPRDKWYIFRQCLNYARLVPEADYENNCVTFPVWLPSFGPTEYIADYQAYLDAHPSIPPPPVVPRENSVRFATVS